MLRFLRNLILLLVFGLITGLLIVWFLVLESEPSVKNRATPSAQDAQMAKGFANKVRNAAKDPADSIVVINMLQANAILRVGGHMLPGMRGTAVIDQDLLKVEGSIPLPWIPVERWLNISAIVPPFEERLTADKLSVGPLPLPADLSIELGRIAANLILGDRRGDKMLFSASRMDIEADELMFHMTLSERSRGSVMTGMFDLLRGDRMPSANEIGRYRELIRSAMDTERLPDEGDFTPYVRFALTEALRNGAGKDLANEYTAAIFGLTQICGAKGFTFVVGRLGLLDDQEAIQRNECRGLRLNGRIDSRQHFLTAAALQAASNRGFSVGIGEIKELHDAAQKRNGFDFTDIAANNSGIRMSNVLMRRPDDDWPALIDRMEGESDIIVDYEGVPGRMSEQEFIDNFGDIDSARYKDMVASIERKIDELPVYRRAP